MKRKYDLRNKRNFVIIFILGIFIIGIFSLFIYKYLHTSRVAYDVAVGSFLQDTNKNNVNVDDDATLKTRWNDTYYLNYQDSKMSLGKRVIVYNAAANNLKLYGRYYEIGEDGKINECNDETVIGNVTTPKFYKLADREYLLVAREIVSEDRSINAKDYLLVELDKMGNAKLSNNKLNLKTIAPTKLVTANYVFDIANETLKYNKLDIDLKKIIGTTNQYKEEKKESSGDGTDNVLNTWNRVDNTVVNDATNNVINNVNDGKMVSLDEIRDKVKTTSIIRVQEGYTQADIDYIVYDPYNEYVSVYAEIERTGKVDVMHLSKTETHMVIDGLSPNSEYKVNFIYTTVENGENKPHKFEELTIRTKKPNYSYSAGVYRISNYTGILTYRVDLQDGYAVSSVNVTISFDYYIHNDDGTTSIAKAYIPSSVGVSGSEKSVYGSISISGYDIVDKDKINVHVDSIMGNYGLLTF